MTTDSTAGPTRSSRPHDALLSSGWWAVLTAVTYFAWLGFSPLTEPDEARYAEIPREMLELGDWITPHLNYVKYFEKPPFLYWVNALTMKLFGGGAFAMRFWPAAIGVMILAISTHLARRMYGSVESRLTLIILATSPLFFGLSQVLLLDMPLAGLMTLCLSALWMAGDSDNRARWMILASAAAAAAVLTKGPVALVLIVAIVVASALWQRDAAMVWRTLHPLPLLLFVILALPWFVAVQQRNPEFFDFFIIKQHLQRYLTPDEHQQPLWFFVPFVVAGAIPWSLVVLAAPRTLWRFTKQLLAGRISPATRFCLVWFTVIFVFFSLSGSKLATYILPAFPPLAILLARFLARLLRRGRTQPAACSGAIFAVLGVILMFGGWVAWEVVEIPEMDLICSRLIVASVLLILGGVATVAVRASGERSIVALALTMFVVLNVAVTAREAAQTYEPLGTTLRSIAGSDDLVILFGHYSQTIPYYAQRRAVMVRSWGELDFGSRQGDESKYFWRDDDQLFSAWNERRRILMVINRNELEEILPRLDPPPHRITGYGKKLLITNRPESAR